MSIYLPLLSEIGAVLFPPLCPICGCVLSSDDETMCASCFHALPMVPMGSFSPDAPFARPLSPLEERLASCPQLLRAASWIYYAPHTPQSQLLRLIKYHGHSRLARRLGTLMAAHYLPTGLFSSVDCIVPVPLHPLRRLRRGYNQSECLAKGVADLLHLPVLRPLKVRHHKSQTSLHGEARRANVTDIFRAAPDASMLAVRQHVLLIDDVCTTGATLLSAASAIATINPAIRISALTLAITSSLT